MLVLHRERHGDPQLSVLLHGPLDGLVGVGVSRPASTSHLQHRRTDRERERETIEWVSTRLHSNNNNISKNFNLCSTFRLMLLDIQLIIGAAVNGIIKAILFYSILLSRHTDR